MSPCFSIGWRTAFALARLSACSTPRLPLTQPTAGSHSALQPAAIFASIQVAHGRARARLAGVDRLDRGDGERGEVARPRLGLAELEELVAAAGVGLALGQRGRLRGGALLLLDRDLPRDLVGRLVEARERLAR